MARTALNLMLLVCLCLPREVMGEGIRVAVYNLEMERKGPGLLLRDIRKGEDPQVAAAARLIAHAAPDILLLLRIDYDHDLHTLSAFAEAVAAEGVSYPHLFALRPNTGMATGLDMGPIYLLDPPSEREEEALFQSGCRVFQAIFGK